MTDPTSADELLSRVLDDEASAEERARVAADGSLEARLRLLQGDRVRLAQPPTALDPATVDLLVSRAMAAATPLQPDVATGAGSPPLASVPVPSNVSPLRRRVREHPAVAAALTAAAALLVVALAVPLLSRLGGGGDDAQQTAEAPASQELDGAATESDAESADSSTVPDLGATDDLDLVATRLAGEGELGPEVFAPDEGQASDGGEGGEQGDAEQAPVPTTTVPGAASTGPEGETSRAPVPPGEDPVAWCREQVVATDPDLDDIALRAATLIWEGEPAVAYLIPMSGDDQVLIVSSATCATLEGPSPAGS